MVYSVQAEKHSSVTVEAERQLDRTEKRIIRLVFVKVY